MMTPLEVPPEPTEEQPRLFIPYSATPPPRAVAWRWVAVVAVGVGVVVIVAVTLSFLG